MASLVGCKVHVTDLIEELHARLPFLNCQIDFTSKVMDVLEERAEDDAGAIWGLWAEGIDD